MPLDFRLRFSIPEMSNMGWILARSRGRREPRVKKIRGHRSPWVAMHLLLAKLLAKLLHLLQLLPRLVARNQVAAEPMWRP